MIAIVDFGGGNVASVGKAFARLGVDARLTRDPREVLGARAVVLPGVGAFGDVMSALSGAGLDGALREAVLGGRPFLGICVGLQALFEESEESPGVAGLGVFRGRVRRLLARKVPQIGWNLVTPRAPGLIAREYYYFVNSYVVEPAEPDLAAATADYEGEFVAAVSRGNMVAVQFHPEKSGARGLELLGRWAAGIGRPA